MCCSISVNEDGRKAGDDEIGREETESDGGREGEREGREG